MGDKDPSITSNSGGICLVSNASNAMQTYRLTPSQWTTMTTTWTIDPATAIVVDSTHDLNFEVFNCSGELFKMTCYAFLPGYEKDIAGYPRFDTSITKNVQAGLFDGSKIDGQRTVSFNNFSLTQGTTM